MPGFHRKAGHSKYWRINTSRVEIRLPRMRDWRQWIILRQNSRDFLEPWEPVWPPDMLTKYYYKWWLNHMRRLWLADQSYAFFLFQIHSNQLMGGVTFDVVRRGAAQRAHIGYWIGKNFARQGYMSEALPVLLQYSFQALGLHRIEAACLPHNQASRAMLEKTGFHYEGIARESLRIQGKWQDHVIYSCLPHDLETSKPERQSQEVESARVIPLLHSRLV